MAKSNGKTTKWTSIIIGLLVIGASVVATFAVMGANIEENTDDIVVLKKEGCKPAQKHITQIAVIETKLDTIQREQEKGFGEIMAELKKPK